MSKHTTAIALLVFRFTEERHRAWRSAAYSVMIDAEYARIDANMSNEISENLLASIEYLQRDAGVDNVVT